MLYSPKIKGRGFAGFFLSFPPGFDRVGLNHSPTGGFLSLRGILPPSRRNKVRESCGNTENLHIQGASVDKMQKEALQVTKEIVVKFIETGRVSPQNVTEIFPAVYDVVHATIAGSAPLGDADDDK